MQLSAEDYPSPDDVTTNGRKKYKTYEDMLPDYTFALGGTKKLQRVVSWLESQEDVVKNIRKRYLEKSPL